VDTGHATSGERLDGPRHDYVAFGRVSDWGSDPRAMYDIARVRIVVATRQLWRNTMDTYLRGRKIVAGKNYEKPSPEVLHLIRKLRWIGMEAEAEQVQMKLRDTTPAGGVITTAHETD